MSSMFTQFLARVLRVLARKTIARYQPGVIGITGSVGKTSAKLAVAAVLGRDRKVRVSQGNMNNEIGLALAILGNWKEKEWKLVTRAQPSGTKKFAKLMFWLRVIAKSSIQLIGSRKEDYPEILILEYGVDKPGDMKKLLGIAAPDVGIVTAIGEIPVHVEFFSGPDAIAKEKGELVEYLDPTGFAIFNADDAAVLALKERTGAHAMTYGFDRGAELMLSGFKNFSEEMRPLGLGFKMKHGKDSVQVKIEGVFGKHQAYAAGAAACVGLIFGMNLKKIAEMLARYRPAEGRMELLGGIKHTYVMNDSYNASPLSMDAALTTLNSLPAKRKVAVLGDMLEIGKYSLEAHERAGRRVAEIADVLVTIGPRAKFIAEAAKEKGMRKSDILSFDRAKEAQGPVQALLQKGDLVLVKGSHAMELERIVEEIKAF